MNRLTSLLAMAIASIGVLASAAADDDAAFKTLQGTWLPVKAELGGKPMPAEVLKSIVLKIDKQSYEVTVAGHPDTGSLALDTASSPKGMTVKGEKGPNAGKTFPSIYQLDGDSLRICYDLSGAKRPAEFATTSGTKLYLVDYKRKKD